MYTLHGARLRLLFSIVFTLTLSWGFTCKTLAQQSPTQNCTWQDPLTGIMAGSTHDNRSTTQVCSVFVVTWIAPTTVSAVTIQFEGSDDGASWTAFTGTSTVVRGTNPSSNVNGSMEIVGTSKLAFVRVNMTAFTGTGSVTAYIKGVNGASASLGTGTGSGGSGTVNPGTAPDFAYYATSTNAVSPATNCSYVSNGITCTGPFNSGSGSGVGGAVDLLQGTDPGTTTNAVTLAAPSSVTAYRLLYPGALGTGGFLSWDNTGVGSFLGSQGNGALVQRSTGSTTTNDCVKYDSNGNTVDAGAPCGTTALSFSALTSGTNTTAAMLVGTGASLGPTGTGTLTATQVPTASGATTTTNGALIYDTTNNNLHAAQNGADAKLAQYTVTPGNGNCVNWVVSAGKIDLGDAGSACGSGGSGGGGVVTYSGPTLSILSGTSFCPIGGGGSCSATETNVDIDSSAAATVSKMYVQLSQALGVGNSVVVTWRDNAVSQTVTCTISGAVATACNDTTHSFNVAGGDLLDYQLVFSGTIVVTPTITIMSAFGTSNVGVTSVTATGPITSSGGTTPNISATYQGNGAKIQASTGTTTTNDCVKFDANGNTVDAGAACGSGGGGGPSVTTGNYASLPASCTHTSTQSDIYGFTNSPYNQGFCTATNTWSIFYPPWGAVTVPPTSLTGASTTLNGAINNSTTTCVVSADLSPAASVPFLALIDTEIVYVSAKGAGNVNWTCLRGFNTTTAASHLNGATVTLTNWQEINFTNATVDLTQGATLLTSVADAANSEKALMTAIPVAPFTITALVNPLIFGASNDSHFGVCVAEGTTAKFYSYIMATDENGNGNFYAAALKKWTNYTTDSAPSANQIVINSGGPPELIIKDVGGGGNITFTIKLSNGIIFQSFAETDTTFLTSGAHSAGICTNPREGTTPVGGWLLSWNVTTP